MFVICFGSASASESAVLTFDQDHQHDDDDVDDQGSVNVCLDSCLGVQCSNGQRGFGRRRRREVSGDAADPNKVISLFLTISVITMIFDDFLND